MLKNRLADFIKDNLGQAGIKVPIESFYPIHFPVGKDQDSGSGHT